MERYCTFLWLLSWTRNIARFHSILSVSLNSVFERRDIFSLSLFFSFFSPLCTRVHAPLHPFPLAPSAGFLGLFIFYRDSIVGRLTTFPTFSRPPSFFSLSRGYFFVFFSFFLFPFFPFPSATPRFTPLLSSNSRDQLPIFRI